MLSDADFHRLVAEIQSQGFDEATAAQYASMIGDTPTMGEDGSLLVLDDNDREVARLKWLKCFGE